MKSLTGQKTGCSNPRPLKRKDDMISQKQYSKDQSPLYAINSKKRLARILGADVRTITRIASDTSRHYKLWETKQKPRDKICNLIHTPRKIQEPKEDLLNIHKKIARLLSRIKKGEFVYSATKGRSYLNNAESHKDRIHEPSFKVDIEKFYPSVKIKKVQNFFQNGMKCAPDIARLLAKICCIHGALPTGSPISPTLSYFACEDMFSWIGNLARSNNLCFSLYVDDMFFSGETASQELRNKVITHLKKNDLRGHKISHFSANETRVITGVAITPKGLRITNKRYKKIRIYSDAFFRSKSPETIQTLGKTLLGQYREASRVEPHLLQRTGKVQKRMDMFKNKSQNM